MTHAFFKALLFLSAGAVIIATHHEQDIFKMGGLRKSLPLIYACFWVGGGALAALPFVTAGFFSKDEILWQTLAAQKPLFFSVGLLGAFLTSVYTFRLIFIVFHGEEKIQAHADRSISHVLPLIILLVLSTFIGAMIHPPLNGVLPTSPTAGAGKVLLENASASFAIGGIGLAWLLFAGNRQFITRVSETTVGQFFKCLWKHAWGFDMLYNTVFVKPFMTLVSWQKRDAADYLVESLIPGTLQFIRQGLVITQNGRVRWYAMSMVLGVLMLLTYVLMSTAHLL
jgi:NADH-quinone oxidoreductase subunit L